MKPNLHYEALQKLLNEIVPEAQDPGMVILLKQFSLFLSDATAGDEAVRERPEHTPTDHQQAVMQVPANANVTAATQSPCQASSCTSTEGRPCPTLLVVAWLRDTITTIVVFGALWLIVTNNDPTQRLAAIVFSFMALQLRATRKQQEAMLEAHHQLEKRLTEMIRAMERSAIPHPQCPTHPSSIPPSSQIEASSSPPQIPHKT